MYTVSSRSALRIRDTRQPGPTNAASQVARNADEAGLRVAALLGLQRGSVFGRGSPARTKADPKIWTASRDCSVHVKRKRSPANPYGVHAEVGTFQVVAQGPSRPCFAAKNLFHLCNPQIGLEMHTATSAIPQHDRFSGSASHSGPFPAVGTQSDGDCQVRRDQWQTAAVPGGLPPTCCPLCHGIRQR